MCAVKKKAFLIVLLCCSFLSWGKTLFPALREPVINVWAQTQAVMESNVEGDKAAAGSPDDYFAGNDSYLILGAVGVLVVLMLITIRLYAHARKWRS